MAIHQYLNRIRAALETPGAFGTEIALGSFFDFPVVEGSMELVLDREVGSPMHAQQRLDGYPVGVLMRKKVRINVTVNLETFGTKALSGVAATNTWLCKLLASHFGVHLSTGTTISGTSATVNLVNFTSAASFKPGSWYAVRNPTTGLFEAREIESITSNAVTNKMAHAAAPVTAGWDVMGAATLYLDNRTGRVPQYLQFACEGAHPSMRWLVKGACLSSITFEGTNPNEITRAKLSYEAPMYLSADGSATTMNLIGALLGNATYVDTNTMVTKDSDLRFGTVTDAVLPPQLNAKVFELALNIKIAEINSHGGIETVAGYIRVHEPPVISGKFRVPFEDLAYWTARDGRTNHRLMFQIGSAASVGGWGISVPTLQVTNIQGVPQDGIQYQEVSWVGRKDEETSKAATDGTDDRALAEAAFRMAAI